MSSKLPDVLTEQEIAQIVKKVKDIRIAVNQILWQLEPKEHKETYLDEYNDMWDLAHTKNANDLVLTVGNIVQKTMKK